MPQKKSFLDGEFNLPKLEEEVLKFWDERGIFEKSLAKNAKKKPFVFYEGPPYANGKPAIHHVLARVVKDVILRYKTMRGYSVPRRAGWDTHGLPVEMAAEKALGFKSKKDIEAFGVKRFNEEAKKQVWIYKDEWERLTNRIGYWLDLENAYVTYAPEYIESIWWTLSQIHKRDLLYKGHKVVPWCTRCGTTLSSHELAQGYKDVTDRSVYIKFKLKNPEKVNLPGQDVYILSWTTTPWTLPGNVALAVGKDIDYAIYKSHSADHAEPDFADDKHSYPVVNTGYYIFAKELAPKILDVLESPSTSTFKEVIKGSKLVGLEYEPLFEVAPLKSTNSYKVYPADFVTTTDGTGVVHTAVMYGEDDYELGKKVGLPQHHTVNEEGKFTKDVPQLTGEYAKSKETEERVFQHLHNHGTLLRIQEYKHEYPFCWRCGTAILYYARTSWFIGMSKLRKELLARNETINWMPEHAKDGRFGEWLREAKDWNLSRERYWGAPLPIWECSKCDHTEVVDSLAALSRLAGGAKNSYWAMRHGEGNNNALDIIDYGPGKYELTKKGMRQVEASIKKFKKALGKKKIDMIFSSEVLRAKETAEMMAKAMGVEKVHFDKRINEVRLGARFESQPVENYSNEYSTDEIRMTKKEPDGEAYSDVRARVWQFMKECEKKYEGKNILIVSHGEPIWLLVQAASGLSDKALIAQKDDIYPDTAELQPVVPRTVPRDDTGLVDLHRPFVDDILLDCPKCKAKMKRVPTVADVWYDSGAMPYAQNHFPFAGAGRGGKISAKPEPPLFPADYISEGMDQTRGWFYTLLAIATALGYSAPYRNVISLGLVNDKFGKKMSKSVGNVVEPFAVIEKFGVDALRWYFFAGSPFGEPKNFDEAEVGKTLRKVHLIVYNSFVFWKTYANVGAKLKPSKTAAKNILDAWILARLDELVLSTSKKLDAYQIREAALEIESFVDDLSRWYIRRSRKRLQRADDAKDYEAASATLGFVLMQLVKLMAPFTPFFSEVLYSAMGAEKESVHLEDWPVARMAKQPATDKKLVEQMKLVREFAALGLAKRAEVGIKVRQPLAMLSVSKGRGGAGQAAMAKEALAILADEVNVKKIFVDPILKEGVELDTTITPELRDEGLLREVSRMVQELRQKAGLAPKDKIALMLVLPAGVQGAITKNEAALKSDVGAKSIEYKKSDKASAQEEAKVDGQPAWIGLRKI